MHVGRVRVTPTRIVSLPFEVETSNRVLRRYHAHADRFIRVTFTDEEGNQYPGAPGTLENFYLRYGTRQGVQVSAKTCSGIVRVREAMGLFNWGFEANTRVCVQGLV